MDVQHKDITKFINCCRNKQIDNASASEKITLLNVNGVVVSTMSTNSDGSAMVTLPEQKGVYLLTVGSLSIKVIRK